jgi:ketosteroid isomerase-like protein
MSEPMAAEASTDATRGISIVASPADRASLLTRLFIEALNARDLDGLTALVNDDVEFRNPVGGRSLQGREALERLVRAAADARLRLARRDVEEITVSEAGARVAVPVIELVGGSEVEGTAVFNVRDGKITAFEVSSEPLRR